MKAAQVVARTVAAASCAAAAGLVAGCGSSPSPAAQPTVTERVTVTAPAQSGTASSPAAGFTPPTGTPGCTTAQLKGTLGPAGAAAGSTYYAVDFTNMSGSACVLYGYPGISFVTGSGQQVGAAATEDPVFPRRLVTLAQGTTAHAELQVTVAQNYPASDCSPVSVHRLKVYPPGQTSALYIPVTATACAKPAVHILAVQSVQPGKGVTG